MSEEGQVWSLDRVDQLERQVRDLIVAGDALYAALSKWSLANDAAEAWCKARFAANDDGEMKDHGANSAVTGEKLKWKK